MDLCRATRGSMLGGVASPEEREAPGCKRSVRLLVTDTVAVAVEDGDLP
jgi:hypothetical protein